MQEYFINQKWSEYTTQEHAVWQKLYKVQEEILKTRAADEFMDNLGDIKMPPDHIPDFNILNNQIKEKTGWTIVCVEGLVPDEVFFAMLAQRLFPSGRFIRKPWELDYLQEPDVFHDVFGHVPLLANPIFADYMQAYGKAGLSAIGRGSLHQLARLYWYTVEFGLIQTSGGLRAYGAGIVSSSKESLYCLESPKPRRLPFDLKQVMRTPYRIDDLQTLYFIIPSFDDLFRQLMGDFSGVYECLKGQPDFTL